MEDTVRLADVQVEDERFRATGATLTWGPAVESQGSYVPPDQPVNATNNEVRAVAWRSDLAAIPSNNVDGGRGTGYTLRYGHWLVGINASYNAGYNVLLPSNFTSGTDLISGTVLSSPVTLAPKTSAVFYLPDAVDPNPKPARILLVNAVALPSPASVVINWSPAAAATGYNVKRATVSGGPYTTIASGLHTRFYSDTTAAAGTAYYYVVSGVNAGGEGGDSAEAAAAPAQSGLVNRARGGTSSASNQNYPSESSSKAFDGTGSRWSNNVSSMTGWLQYDFGAGIIWAVTRYDVTSISIAPERDPRDWTFLGSNDGINWTTLDTQAGQTFSRSQTRQFLFSNTNGYRYYRFNVTAVNGGVGNTIQLTELGLYASSAGAPPALAAPAGLTAAAGDKQVLLNWTTVGGALTYNVKRSAGGGAYVTIGNTDQVWYLDATAVDGATYSYVVTAVGGGPESAPSNPAGATPAAAAIPPAPAGTAALGGPGNGQITLSWSASPGGTSYTVKRSGSSGGPYSPLATGVTDASYLDSGLSTGATWYYLVTAVNGSGESAPSAIMSASAQPDYRWSAAPASGSWNVGGNWSGTTPANGAMLDFDNSSIVSLTNNLSGLVAGGLVFNFAGSSFVINGNAVTLGGNITNNAAPTETVNLGMTLTAARTLTVNSGNLVLGGVITDGGATFGLFKEGPGKLSLAGVANTYGGGIIIDAGVVQAGTGASGSENGGAFGTGSVTVHPGTALQFLPNSTSSNFSFANNFVVDGGTIIGLDGKQHLGTSAKTINITGNGGTLQTKWNGKDLYLDGQLTGAGPLLLQNLGGGGPGTIHITNDTNTFSGVMTVDAVTGKGQSLSIETNNCLQYATVNVVGATGSLSGLLFTTTAPNLGALAGSGNFAIPAGVALSVGSNGGSTTCSGTVSGAGGITKTGTGTMTLSGTNSYSGLTTASGGTLNVAGPIAGGLKVNGGAAFSPNTGAAMTVNLAGPLTLAGGATLDLELGTASDSIALAGAYTAPAAGTVTINIAALSGFGPGAYSLITGASGISAASFTPGSAPLGYNYTFSASGGTLSLAVTAWTGLQSWRYQYFGTAANSGTAADTADPDGDERANLLEYATGTSPWVPDAGPAVTPGLSPDGTKLTLTFNRIADPALTYTVEATNDLTISPWPETVWTGAGAANTAGSVTITDTAAIATHPHRFLRLRITP